MTPHADLFQGGAALKTIDLTTGRVQTLLDVPDGVVRDPEVHFDGRRIVFALRRNRDEDYHIWEIHADGTGLRQLTAAAGVSDFDPLYLPDDRIAFSSTREPKYNQCSRDHGANLFRMEPDGANIHQIGKNNLFDNHGTLTPDGRILYARWEYVDRNFGDAHGIWTVNPDGTNQAIYWGNNTASPGAVYYPRIIPGTQQMLCVFGMHHYRLWGALAIVDRQPRPGRPRTGDPHLAGGRDRARAGRRRFRLRRIRFGLPQVRVPVSAERQVLPVLADDHAGRPAAGAERRAVRRGDGDLPGRRVRQRTAAARRGAGLLRSAAACARSRARRSSRRAAISPTAKAISTWPTSIAARTWRACRAGRSRACGWSSRRRSGTGRPGAWFGQGYTAPAMNWHSLENKRILGTVPVEEDGSAYFAVPSETFVYFQLLDENGMMIQSMRSGASVQSGEHAGCAGCHEDRRTAPPAPPDSLGGGSLPLAWRRPPSRLTGWYGPPREFSFMAEVQPVFNQALRGLPRLRPRGRPETEPGPDRTLTFNTAYTELWRKGYLHCVGAGPAEIQPAYSWGSHASKLVQVLRTPSTPGHEQLQLTPEEFDRIVTWVDLNGVYYPTYACAYPDSLTGRIPLDAAQLGRLAQLTGEDFGRQRSFSGCPGPEVSFDRPELSPLLAEIPGQERSEVRRGTGDHPGGPAAAGSPSPGRHAGVRSQRAGPTA